ncbi:MAG: hypothetical protein VB130_04585 [Clostridium sp.]|nr:hypothetical protein [Clostridium sp.]
MIEDDDTIDVLDEYGLMQGNKNVPQSLLEFIMEWHLKRLLIMAILY